MSYHCDPTLLTEVRKYGKFDTAGCFNCGSCIQACDPAGDQASFPWRSTRHVIMCLRQVLNEGLDPWICCDCGDCSTVCPRQTEPREAMMTLRRYLASVYDWTGIASKINRSKVWHIGSLLFVAVFVLLLIISYHLYVVKMPFSDFASTSMGLEHMSMALRKEKNLWVRSLASFYARHCLLVQPLFAQKLKHGLV